MWARRARWRDGWRYSHAGHIAHTALRYIEAIARHVPEVVVVRVPCAPHRIQASAMAGARFAVSPGYTHVGQAHDMGLPHLRLTTGSEIMAAQATA
jgi:2-dehydro-3-deoxyphosphogluconate aldolase/(4S)-4-hydroxy-2-oxoglutarate aldolase